MASAAATSRVIPNSAARSAGSDEFVLNARVEFCASLQLLAERARFVTGADFAAVALREGERYICRAAAGAAAPEIGSALEVANGHASDSAQTTPGKTLLVSILNEQNIEGLFKLSSEKFEFSDHDLQAVGRLAEMVGTALGQLNAAERSQEIIFSASTKTPSPTLWHAPDYKDAASSAEPQSGTSHLDAGVRTCQSCGFPVSNGRSVCFDCEQHGRAPSASAGLFSTEEPESWIRAHGYTIASLIVSAVAAALIYWLR